MRLLIVSLGVLLLGAMAWAGQGSQVVVAEGNAISQPAVSEIIIDHEDLPLSATLGAWVRFVTTLLGEDDQAAADFLRSFALDPTSPSVRRVVEVQTALEVEYSPQRLALAYRSVEGIDAEDEARGFQFQQRRHTVGRAQLLGHEVGAWLADLEAEGVDVDAFLAKVQDSPYFSVSKSFRGERPDLESLRLRSASFQAALELQLGRPVNAKERIR